MAGLARHVSVRDDNGTVKSFGPGDEVPSWAAKKITNPAVWKDGESPHDADDEGPADGPPPRSGRGSGEKQWRAYAESKDVDVSDVEGRDEIIAYLEGQGVPVE